jgi:Family of unknown function (DUF5640)
LKRFTQVLAIILVCAVFVTAFAGCLASPQKQIIGKWKDSTGIVGYEFMEDGTAEFSVLGVPVKGTYTMDTKEQTVTLTGTILVKSVTKTYKYQIEESSLILTDVSSGNAATYVRETVATTTTK